MERHALVIMALLALAAVAIAADAPAAGAHDQPTEATVAADKHHKHHSQKEYDDYDKDDKDDSYDKDDKKSDSYEKEEKYSYSKKKSDSYKKKDNYESDDDYKKKYAKDDYYTKGSYDYKNSYSGYDDAYYSSAHGWHDGEGDCNRPWDHIQKHKGECMANRHVAVSAGAVTRAGLLQPLNYADGCPSASAPGNKGAAPIAAPAAPCNVPAYCGAPGAGPNTPGSCACLTENGAAPGQFPDYLRYEQSNVEQHFWNQPSFPMVDQRKHTFECVDARRESPMLGTPGGDLAEAIAAAMAIMYLKDTSFKRDIADEVFRIFSEEVANPERPLYFHTDDTRLRQMFIELRNKGDLNANAERPSHPIPSAFPFRGPSADDSDRQVWLNLLSTDKYNGCGHIRLMLTDNTKSYFSVDVEKRQISACTADSNSCIDAQVTARYFIKKFFSFWWFTPSGSWQRKNTAFVTEEILEGPLQGKAVAIIQKNPKTACNHEAPLVRPAFGGSQVFVYHGDAVADWREYVVNEYLTDYVKSLKLTPAKVLSAWNKIAGMQLGATLAYLNPANKVGQWLVDVDVKPYEPYEYESKGESK